MPFESFERLSEGNFLLGDVFVVTCPERLL